MSTTTITLTCAQSGTSYTTNLNSALGAIDTCHSGTTAPATNVVQGKLWLDLSSSDMVLKIYDGTSWLPMLDLDAGVMKATAVDGLDLTNWTVTETSGVLYFATGGVNKMKLDASGNMTCVGSVTAYGTM